MFQLSTLSLFDKAIREIPDNKLLINTINAYSFCKAQKDNSFGEALIKSDILLPDGIGIVWAIRFLKGKKLKKIAGADLFYFEADRLNTKGGTCFFLGSTNSTLQLIQNRLRSEYPDIKVHSYSPPYKAEFTPEDNSAMISEINKFKPDVLFIGLTAPKQEKWAYTHFRELEVGHVCSIGAVFDFYAGTINRAPKLMIDLGLEWFYRLIKEPRRMWRRYLIGNIYFIWLVLKEKILK